MPTKLKQFVPSRVCLSCDGCCRFQNDTSDWRPHAAGGSGAAEADTSADGRLKTRCVHGEEQCVFFNGEDRTCRIYQTRPFECRLYPFMLLKKGRETVVAAHLSCPHVQEKDGSKEAAEYTEYLREYFEQPDVKAFLRENPALATDHSEYRNEFKELFVLPDELFGKKEFFGQYASPPHQLSSFSFVSIYLWKDFFQFRFEVIDGYLCVFAENEVGCFLYLPPLGKNFSLKAVEESFCIMDRANGNHKGISRIENVPQAMLDRFPPEYISSAKPDEYCYNRRDIAELKGNALKSQRSSYNQFAKNHKHEYREFQPGDFEPCAALYDAWAVRKKERSDDPVFLQMVEDNRTVHRLAMDAFDSLGLTGRVVLVDGKIKAYTFGYCLNDEMFCVLFEIADPDIKGLAVFIFSKLCADPELERYSVINVMDDFCLDNVRQTKLSFKPSRSITSYIVKRK